LAKWGLALRIAPRDRRLAGAGVRRGDHAPDPRALLGLEIGLTMR
jgi:hypothetical protein